MRLNTTSDRLRLCCLRRTCSTVRCWSYLHSAHTDASACNIPPFPQLDHKASPRKRIPPYDIPDNSIMRTSLINRSIPVDIVVRTYSIWCKLMALSDHAEVVNRNVQLLVAQRGTETVAITFTILHSDIWITSCLWTYVSIFTFFFLFSFLSFSLLKWKTKFQLYLKCKSKFYIGRNYLCTYLNSIDCQ